jgi:Polycystin cation channel
MEEFESIVHYNNWREVPFKNKLRFFNGWYIWNTITNIFQMISCIILLLIGRLRITEDNIEFVNIVLGFAVFMTWIQIIQYLEFWKSIILMTTTLQATSIKVFFSMYVPIFIGFTILGNSSDCLNL